MTQICQSPSTDFTSTTLNGTITDTATTISVNDASTIVTPCYAVIDREDSNGVATSTAREVIYISSKSSNDLTVVRGVDNSTKRAHNDSAILEPLITVGFWDDFYDAYDAEHNPFDGTHDITKVAMLSGATVQTLASKILSSPTITFGSLSSAIISSSTITLASLSTIFASSVTVTYGGLASVAILGSRITKRGGTVASAATIIPTGDTADIYTVTAQAAAGDFAAPSGTPTEGQGLILRIEDDGTARALAFNAIYRAGTDIALPTTTVLGKVMYLGFIYNNTDSKFDLVAKVNNI